MEDKKKLPIQIKLLIAVGCVVILFVTVFLLKDTLVIGNYRLFLKRVGNFIANDNQRRVDIEGRVVESDSFDEIDENIPIRIERPQWLPEGYELDYADYISYENDEYNIEYMYRNEDGGEINFNINTLYMEVHERDFSFECEIFFVNDLKIYYLNLDDDFDSCSYNNIFRHRVSIGFNGLMDKETFIKIIENMG